MLEGLVFGDFVFRENNDCNTKQFLEFFLVNKGPSNQGKNFC